MCRQCFHSSCGSYYGHAPPSTVASGIADIRHASWAATISPLWLVAELGLHGWEDRIPITCRKRQKEYADAQAADPQDLAHRFQQPCIHSLTLSNFRNAAHFPARGTYGMLGAWATCRSWFASWRKKWDLLPLCSLGEFGLTRQRFRTLPSSGRAGVGPFPGTTVPNFPTRLAPLGHPPRRRGG